VAFSYHLQPLPRGRSYYDPEEGEYFLFIIIIDGAVLSP
jgi:hypothetical protein